MNQGYIDLQVNGYGGVDYHSNDLTADQLHHSCAVMREHGVAGFLYTITTSPVDWICANVRKMLAFREKDALVKEMIVGIHIEGPYISAVDGYRGAHPREHVREASLDGAKQMVEASGGLLKIVTLAPEQDPGFKVTIYLTSQGVRVAGGHSNASMEQLNGAIDNGLAMWTHLGNGCPMMMHRHDNIVQRVLSLSDKLWLQFIADGAHVAFPALKNYLRAAGPEKTIVVTDAVAPAGSPPGRYTFGKWDLQIGEDLVCRSPDGSHLVGSAVPFYMAHKRLRENVGLSEDAIRRLTIDNPKKAMGL
jgi:N-acetylglucosamine-6-phosphate deacetylase